MYMYTVVIERNLYQREHVNIDIFVLVCYSCIKRNLYEGETANRPILRTSCTMENMFNICTRVYMHL